MRNKLFILLLSMVAILPLLAGSAASAKENPRVLVETSKGNFTLELYRDKAPITVKNFIFYVKNRFYDQTLIHRVRKNFVLQGGGYTIDNIEKETSDPIKNEAGNGLKNKKYTISMARTPEINSATSQFFINFKDNANLDHKGEAPNKFGYAVFGKVIEGQETIDKIGKVKTKKVKGMYRPAKKIIIKSMRMAGEEKEEKE